MRQLVLSFLLVLLLCGCSGTAADDAARNGPDAVFGFVVLADLSDRVDSALNPGQAQRDIAAARAAFAVFERHVSEQSFVFSADRFALVAAPQKGTDILYGELADSLTIDMNKLSSGGISAFRQARNRAFRGLEELYAGAMRLPSYPGADIWSFVRHDLSTYELIPTRPAPVRNILVILTDGYLAFEDAELRGRPVGTYMATANSSLAVPKLDLSQWEVVVLEMKPRTFNDREALEATWRTWFQGMHVRRFAVYFQQDGQQHLQDILERWVSAG